MAYLGGTRRGVMVGDPLEGKLTLDEEQFSAKYRFDRFALNVGRRDFCASCPSRRTYRTPSTR